ncbi:MotE family protein [Sphingobium subterraneum]|uniref:Flagellar motility protein MotE (MotC chaperone) n=1 Tax=Sphingobium subterraneum TaxID=627688 RepID=A0A841IVS7_9SPHN|nr:hypothetical protein [Sphingobium subterraneum]MBB6122773.1 flagellar motility protein MotE (MotC chaperone) [Sphingobium subterraneum]
MTSVLARSPARQRPLLLIMLTGAAALSAVAGVVGATAPPPAAAPAPQNRMAATIDDAIASRDRMATANMRALDLREQAAKAAQARLSATLAAKQQQDSGPAADPSAPDQYDALAKIYQAMKPAKAAPVFEALDLEVQYLVAKKMRERSTAMLLAAMSPSGAARLTMALAGRKPLRKEPDASRTSAIGATRSP